MIPLDPVTLTGNPQDIDLRAKLSTGTDNPIRVANESYFALQVALGGDTHWLDPWTADVFYPPRSITKLSVNPSILLAGIGTGPASSLLITLAEPGEQFAGAYPVALSRQFGGQINIGSGTVTIGSGTVNVGNNVPVLNAAGTQLGVVRTPTQIDSASTTAGGSNVTHNAIAVPSGTHSLMVVGVNPSGGAAFGKVKITGASTGLNYPGSDLAHGIPADLSGGPVLFPAILTDSTVNIVYTADAVLATNFWVIALPDPVGVNLMEQVPAILFGGNPLGVGALYTPGEAPGTKGVLGVTHSGSNPAPWEAPTTDAGILITNGVSPATLVTGIGGQRIRVWSWKFEGGTVAAARFMGLRGSSRTAFDGTFAATWLNSMTAANGNAGGIALPAGDSLVVDLTAANGETVRAAAGYSQA